MDGMQRRSVSLRQLKLVDYQMMELL